LTLTVAPEALSSIDSVAAEPSASLGSVHSSTTLPRLLRDPATFEVYWERVEDEISKDGNEIEIKRINEYKGAKTIQTLTLKRK
jgi:hypothetical protein